MRLIDAELIIDYLIDEGQYNGEKYNIKWDEQIKFSPSEVDEIVARTVPTIDAVPVVRCKDCKHCMKADKYELWCQGHGSPLRLTTADDYCSKGERRDSNDTNTD